jgi:hypothetical protein
MDWNDLERPKSAKTRLLECAWLEVARAGPSMDGNPQMRNPVHTPQERLAQLHREQRRKRLTVKELGAIWLDACHGIFHPEDF